MIKEVVVLGGGSSVSRLTQAEKEYINNCEVRLGINKFIIHYKNAGIIPNIVYFLDSFSPNANVLIQQIYDVARKNNLRNVLFIMHKRTKNRFFTKYYQFKLYEYYFKLLEYGTSRNKKVKYLLLKNTKELLKALLRPSGYPLKTLEYPFLYFYDPVNYSKEFIEYQPFMNPDNTWSDTLDEPLFHFRGSLTTVLNYVSIKYPGYKVRLIGIDMNNAAYFYEDPVNQAEVKKEKNWAAEIHEKGGLHCTAATYKGTSMLDKMEYIVKSMRKTGNELSCINKDSLLVEQGFLPYERIISN